MSLRNRFIGSARRIAFFVILLAIGGLTTTCTSTNEICNRACDAWADCWNTNMCWIECRDDGDWSSDYADCCEAHAGDCWALENICG